MLAAQVVPLFVKQDIEPIQYVLRCYLSVFSLLILLAEIEFSWTIKRIPIFNNWIHRGLFYSFFGLVGVEESVAIDLDGESIPATFIHVSSWMMVASGVIYFVLGIFCMNKVRDRCVASYEEKLREAETKKKIMTELDET